MVRALRFVDLLYIGTIVWVAELYIPELLTQLPYAKKLNLIPGTVKSALESRDVWFVKEHGDLLTSDEPPFAYLGNLAHGFHSSIEGTVSSESRPIVRALHGPDTEEFDLWCDSIWVPIDEGADIDLHIRDTITVDSGLKQLEDTGEEFYDPDNLLHTKVSQTPPKESASSTSPIEVSPKTEVEEGKTNCQRVCKGLLVDTVDNLGFGLQKTFLTEVSQKQFEKSLLRTTPPVKTPCMTNIASTVYSKCHDNTVAFNNTTPHTTLIEAIWVLFKSPTSEMTGPFMSEPSTPEALAVMMHLVVNVLKPYTESLGVCNDIMFRSNSCDQESQFIPVAAMAGGLFGVNMELHVKGYTYNIINNHYRMWAPGVLTYTNKAWYTSNESVTVRIPCEISTVNCYHTGTSGAYMIE